MKNILITGGTGSFGKAAIKCLLRDYSPERIVVFSRDELKQHKMRTGEFDDKRLRFFIGNVRDRDRLYRAFNGIDTVIHAAALKQVPTAEYNPFEAVKTNILGTENVIDAAIDCGISKVMVLSTDKAVNPINLYGATKLCAEKLTVAANSYSKRAPKLSVVRYGNVSNSRGSVIPLFKKKKEAGVIPITDMRMTRFWIELEQAASFILSCITRMTGGEVFIPKTPSIKIVDLAKAIAPNCKLEIIGIRPGEKLHEVLLPVDESRNAYEFKDYFVVNGRGAGKPCSDRFTYTSDTNSRWLTVEDLKRAVG